MPHADGAAQAGACIRVGAKMYAAIDARVIDIVVDLFKAAVHQNDGGQRGVRQRDGVSALTGGSRTEEQTAQHEHKVLIKEQMEIKKKGARDLSHIVSRAPFSARALATALAFFVYVMCGAAILEIEAQGELHDAGRFLACQVGDYAEG